MRQRRSGAFGMAGGLLALACLSGCLNGGAPSLSAKEAFARSASALSGSENYGFTGEVAVVDPTGTVAKKAAYEGEVRGHGDLKLQWKSTAPQSQAVQMNESSALQPLHLLEAMNAGDANIAYAEKQTEPGYVRFKIKLENAVARDRIANGLREELTALGSEKVLVDRDPDAARRVLARAEDTLKKALSTLQVSTVCYWKAEKRTWFPSELQEETTLKYRWKGKTYNEKRVSSTYFLPASRNGTINGRD